MTRLQHRQITITFSEANAWTFSQGTCSCITSDGGLRRKLTEPCRLRTTRWRVVYVRTSYPRKAAPSLALRIPLFSSDTVSASASVRNALTSANTLREIGRESCRERVGPYG